MELVTIVTNGGPYALAGLLGYLFTQERAERIAVQARFDLYREAMTEKVVAGLIEGTAAIQALSRVITGGRDA